MSPHVAPRIAVGLLVSIGAAAPVIAAPAPQVRIDSSRIPISFEANRGQTDPAVQFVSRGPGYSLSLAPGETVFALRSPRRPCPANSSARGAERGEAEVVRMSFVGANAGSSLVGRDELPGRSNYFIGNDPAGWRTGVPNYARVESPDLYPGIGVAFHGGPSGLEYDLVVEPGARPDSVRLAFEGVERVEIAASGDLVLKTRRGELRQAKPLVYQEREAGGARRVLSADYVRLGRREVGFRVAAYDPSEPLVIDPVLSYSTYLGGSSDDTAYGLAVDAEGNAYVTGSTLSLDFPIRRPAQSKHGLNALTEDAFVTKLSSSGAVVVYSTYLGGGDYDFGRGIAVDAAGAAYVTGYTASTEFPTVNPFQPARNTYPDAFVAKLDPAGSALVYSSYLGGNDEDYGLGIAVDGSGRAYVTGRTRSTDFPAKSPFQPALGGGFDAFVSKISASGHLVYSSYLGGSSDESGNGVAVDASGAAYLTGSTGSADFPTAQSFQPALRGASDAFVAKIGVTGFLAYSSYLGFQSSNDAESGNGIAVDTSGDAYVTGSSRGRGSCTVCCQRIGSRCVRMCPQPCNFNRAFVSKVNAAGSALAHTTFLGGSSSLFSSAGSSSGTAVAVDGAGDAYVTGSTTATTFPRISAFQAVKAGGSDAFVAKISAAGAIVYSSFLGGSGNDAGYGIGLDGQGNAYVAGGTSSVNFPTQGPFQPAFGGGNSDAFVTRVAEVLSPAGLAVDPSPGSKSDGDGVLEPGESAVIAPSWSNPRGADTAFAGSAATLSGPAGAAYSILDNSASYGTIAAGTAGSCAAAADCYSMSVTVPTSRPASRPATHWDAAFTEWPRGPIAAPPPKTWTLHLGDSFADVPRSHPFYEKIETLLHGGITAGCTTTAYCPGQDVSRSQVSIFLARRLAGGGTNVPASGSVGESVYDCEAGGVSLFSDVSPTDVFCKHVHFIAANNVDAGCAAGLFCPGDVLSRLRMATFVANAIVNPTGDAGVPISYGPDAATGLSYSCDAATPNVHFTDVPATDPACKQVHYLWAKGIITGCGADTYCPAGDVTRDQMAKFLVNAFGLTLYGP